MEDQIVLCRSCKQEIVNGATKCHHCSALQGKKWWLSDIAFYAGILIALSSLITIAISSWKFMLQSRSSELSAQMISFEGKYLEFAVFNYGSRAGVIYSLAIEAPYAVECDGEQPILKQYNDIKSQVIKPGESVLIKTEKSDGFSTFFSEFNPEALTEKFGSLDSYYVCSMELGFFDFDSKFIVEKFDFPCGIQNECKKWPVN